MKYMFAVLLKVVGLLFVVSTTRMEQVGEVVVLVVMAFIAFAFELLINNSTKDGSIIFPDDKEEMNE